MRELEPKKEVNNVEMGKAILLITDVLDTYASTVEDEEKLDEVRGIIDRFNQLSRDGKQKVTSSFISRVNEIVYDVNEETCNEKGHDYTRWRKLSYCYFGLNRGLFCEYYGSEYVYFHRCKVCNESSIITEEDYKNIKKKRLKKEE